jgi:hypothetical protein
MTDVLLLFEYLFKGCETAIYGLLSLFTPTIGEISGIMPKFTPILQRITFFRKDIVNEQIRPRC